MAVKNAVAKNWYLATNGDGTKNSAYPNGDKPVLPTAPTLGTPSQINSTTLRMTLTGGAGATSWTLQRSPAGAGTWSDVATPTVGAATVDATVVTGTSYDFRLKATNATGDAYSNVVTGAATSLYSPFKLFSFDSGAPGSSMAGADGFLTVKTTNSATNTRSTDIPGPFGGGQVGRISWPTAGLNFFGGNICDVGFRPSEGSECWIRIYHYFPNDFCFQNDAEPDAWGQTKWLRMQWGTGTVRQTFQIGNWSTSACNTFGTLWGATNEGIGSSQNQQFTSPPQITRGAWKSLEWYIKFSSDIGVGKIRCWLDGVYGGEKMCVTLPDTIDLEQIIFGDYINGGSKAGNTFYIDEGIITFQTPDDLDSGGRPMIGPNRKVEDF